MLNYAGEAGDDSERSTTVARLARFAGRNALCHLIQALEAVKMVGLAHPVITY